MKMKLSKRFLRPLLTILCCFLLLPAAVFAEDQLVFDDAGLFSTEEAGELETQAKEAKLKTGMTLAVATTDDAGGKTAREYADDYFDEKGFVDGALLLIDMDNREAFISTGGSMISILTDQRIELLLDDVFAKLPDGEYAQAASAFLLGAVQFIGKGVPSNQHEVEEIAPEPIPASQRLLFIGGAAAAGLFVGGICVVTIRKGYNTGSVKAVYPYREKSRMALTQQTDTQVHQFVTSRAIPKQTTSSGSGGRSTTHRSSSGTRHGGGGRKF